MKIQQILTVWFPRVLAVVYILFISLFSFDVFQSDSSLLEEITGFLIHNIPTLFLILALYLSWKNSIKGGIAFIVIGAVFTIFFNTYQRWDTFVLISAPLLLIGILFLLNKKNN
jgi:hypothetical protein